MDYHTADAGRLHRAATAPVPAPKPAIPPAPEVVRYDRYLLINTRPDEAQRNPLHQIVNINLPLNLKLTVGDAFTGC